MTLPAGAPGPQHDTFDRIPIVCAVDGDGTALCNGRADISQVDHHGWLDVPEGKRCTNCATIMAAATVSSF